MSKVLSIIVPTYNMEEYLPRCLSSLIVSEEKIEVIVVNDGSKDKSLSIAREFEKKYPDVFVVIDKENGNYGSCINAGLKAATGKYVKILDADDYFMSSSLVPFLETLNNLSADLVLTDVIIDQAGKPSQLLQLKYPEKRKLNTKELCNYNSFLSIGMHHFAYRRAIFEDLNYFQTEGISYTDQEWIMMPMTKVCEICYIPLVVYRYQLGRDNQTMSPSVLKKQLGHLMTVSESMLKTCTMIKQRSDRQYFFEHTLIQLEFIYRQVLIEGVKIDMDLFEKYDRKIYYDHPDIYNLLEKKTHHGFPYIKYWNNHKNAALPLNLPLYSILRRKFNLFRLELKQKLSR